MDGLTAAYLIAFIAGAGFAVLSFVLGSFGRDLAPVVAGGTSFATGNARISAKPDAAGNSATPRTSTEVASARV